MQIDIQDRAKDELDRLLLKSKNAHNSSLRIQIAGFG